ncbi:hypothetical protein CTheo_1495 [Ceratobasidium theobromae]|uniref:Uncharacterized protein n=1 Tax=Ceratobasidium theobromae TaxID=1582974 RepID=A0A5N5QTL8_9AGAM|nr:hypothetical protein CTheo_1495 [Ceratobasidium theobromae]
MQVRVITIGVGIILGTTHQRADLFGKDYVDNAAKQCVARVQGPPPRRLLGDIPLHPVYNLPDLEDAPTTIKWPKFRAAVKEMKLMAGSMAIGKPGDSGGRQEFDALPEHMVNEWRKKFRDIKDEWLSRGVRIEWHIIEGFVLYYDPEVVKSLDIRFFLRSPGSVLKRRRESRRYVQPDGTVWVDPPHFWEHLAYPAYIRSHSHFFCNGDIEQGAPSQEAKSANLIMLEGEGTAQGLSPQDIFQRAAHVILQESGCKH